MALGLVLAMPALPARAETCPLSLVEAGTLPSLLAKARTMRRTEPDAVAYTSKVDRDDDGAPTAYHRGMADSGSDPGLDHICVGGSVLEFADGQLKDRYGTGGSVGQLSGKDPKTGASRSQMCKADYIAIRDAGFPACGPGHLCMIWYGIAAAPRDCGYPSSFGGAKDRRCGAPVRTLDVRGEPTDYYLTTTALRRPGAPGDSAVQSDYVDAARVPYIVLPGGLNLPVATPWSVGDIALVAWKGRSVYAVVGDTGPGNKIGEASRAALSALSDGKSVAAIDISDPATTLVFPGTAVRLKDRWPLTAADIAAEGAKLVQAAGGTQALANCPGLAGIR
jgi:hypothetical protein